MKNKILTITSILLVLLTGCFKDETPLNLIRQSPNSNYAKLNCDNEENNMVFFDLETGAYQSAPNKKWHLAFDATPHGNSVRVNLSRANFHLYEYSSYDFDELSTDFIIKNGTEKMDSVSDWYYNNAISNITMSPSKVYVYTQESTDNIGLLKEKIKFQIIKMTSETCQIKFLNSNLIGAKAVYFSFDKDNSSNFNYLNFKRGGEIVDIEPAKESWDIVFTQYRDMIKFEQDNKYYPYQVLGVLTNPYHTLVYEMNPKTNFNDVNHDHCKFANWCDVSNTIGFDWKYYSISNGVYTTDTSKMWLFKDQEMNMFKLRFINYYSTNGKSGYPSIEYAKFQ